MENVQRIFCEIDFFNFFWLGILKITLQGKIEIFVKKGGQKNGIIGDFHKKKNFNRHLIHTYYYYYNIQTVRAFLRAKI